MSRVRRTRVTRRVDPLTPVWVALADPTRRGLLDALRGGPRTSGDLAARFPTTRFAVRKHLNVLESVGLVLVRRRGRERWNYLNPAPLQMLYERWVTPYEAMWAGRATRLKRHLEGSEAMPEATIQATVAQVELELDIAAPPEKVWRALVEDTTFWWPKSFYTGPAKGFHVEPVLGGKVYEDWGNGTGVVWYHVFAINPGVSLDLAGCLAVPYGPAHTLLHIELAATPAGGTTFKLSDSTIGVAGDASSKTDGWKEVFADGLKAYVEQRRPVGKPS